jgi:hypothetical protein
MKSYITIKKWEKNYLNPILLEKNKIVEIIERKNNNPDWGK